MVITSSTELPPDEELSVQEVDVGSPSLRAASFHMGKYCENQSNEFMLCRYELNDPRKCLGEGKAVTACALDFFQKIKKSCSEEFTAYANCLDKSSPQLAFKHCRRTQAVYDKCVMDNLGIERPHFGYFCRPKVHKTDRPAPEPPKPTVYEDATPGLPEDYPRPPARYGSRFFFLN